jgi:hypothetical protein
MVDSFHPSDSFDKPGVMQANVLDQFRLRIGRPCNQHRAGAGNGFGDGVKIFVIRGGVPAPDRVRFVMDMPGRMIRMQNQPFNLRRAEVKYARLMVIDPDHRMIVMLGHESFLFRFIELWARRNDAHALESADLQ